MFHIVGKSISTLLYRLCKGIIYLAYALLSARHKQVAFTTMFHIVGKSIAGKAKA
jgi:hypothetical protein